MVGQFEARIKNGWVVGSRKKGWLDGWEQGLRMVGWLGAKIKNGWLVGNKDKGQLDGWEKG